MSGHISKIYVLGFLMGCAIGIVIPLSALYFAANGLSSSLTGFLSSLYFIAMLIGSRIYEKLLKKWKSYQIITTMLTVSAVFAVLIVYIQNCVFWGICIFMLGMGVSFNFITVQSCLNQVESEDKIKITGIYSFCYGAGFAVSVIAGSKIFERSAKIAFIVAGILLLLDALLVRVFRLNIQIISGENKSFPYKVITLCAFGGFLYGFIESAMSAFFEIYLLDFMVLSKAGLTLTLFMAGGMLGIIPLTMLTGKLGFRKSCLLYSALGAGGYLGILLTHQKMLFAGFTGVFIGILYPLTLAGLNEIKLDKSQIVYATGIYVFVYSLGSAMGPLSSGWIMDIVGGKGIILLCAVLLGGFNVSCIIHMVRSRAYNKIKTGSN